MNVYLLKYVSELEMFWYYFRFISNRKILLSASVSGGGKVRGTHAPVHMGPLDKHDNSYRTENSELFDLSFICNRNHWFVINFLFSGCLQQQQKQKEFLTSLVFKIVFKDLYSNTKYIMYDCHLSYHYPCLLS